MRVLFLQDHALIGGAARAANRYAARLREMGIQVAQACGDRVSAPEGFLIQGKPPRGWRRMAEFFQSNFLRDATRRQRALQAWLGAIQKFRPDIIWLHNLHGAWKWGWSLALAEAAVQAGPTIWTLHDLWPMTHGATYLPQHQIAGEFSDSPVQKISSLTPAGRLLLTAPSQWVQGVVHGIAPQPPCMVLPYVLDTQTYHPRLRDDFRRRLGLQDEDFLFLAAAENLEDPRKRISLLLAAWRQLQKKGGEKKMFLGLLGRNPPDSKSEASLIVTGGLTAESEVAGYMAAADLFIHVAEVETFGQVLEEAQSCGTPVLAAKAGGMAETFEEGLSGWGLDAAEPEPLAQQMKRLLKKRGELARMRDEVRGRILKRHSPEQFRRLWMETQQQILGPGPGSNAGG